MTVPKSEQFQLVNSNNDALPNGEIAQFVSHFDIEFAAVPFELAQQIYEVRVAISDFHNGFAAGSEADPMGAKKQQCFVSPKPFEPLSPSHIHSW